MSGISVWVAIGVAMDFSKLKLTPIAYLQCLCYIHITSCLAGFVTLGGMS